MTTRRGFLGVLAAAIAGRKFLKKKRQPLPPTGVSVRIIRTYNRDTDRFENRFDVLYGVGFVKPEYAVRVVSGDFGDIEEEAA